MKKRQSWLPSAKAALCRNLLLVTLITAACTKTDQDLPDDNQPPQPGDTEFAMGLLGTDNTETIPSDIFLGMGAGNLPARYSIVDKLPPIGDQGQYGTCVAWAAGYNLKTALNAIDNNWKASDLSNPAKQSSPKDLFLAIPTNSKGTNCNGTNFEPAFQQMINRGIASQNTVPYTNMGSCNQSAGSTASAEAAKNKLSSFRKINLTVNEIKTYVSQNRPVVFGTKLSDNFMTWRGDQVLSSHSTFTKVGQHALHAMMVVGYDDTRGANGAFRVVNSWGTAWGDKGFIWIDYNFFVNPQFAYIAFVATNGQGQNYDPVDPPVTPTGDYDLVPWNVSDKPNTSSSNARSRKMDYNVYNVGTRTVTASQRWNVCYLYYNAYNAKDFGIIIYDEYTDRYGTLGQSGEITSGGYGLVGNWWNNINLPANKGAAEVQYNSKSITWTYTMPLITGYYYLVSIADAFDVIKESNEANNYFFLTNSSGGPLSIKNGVIQSTAYQLTQQATASTTDLKTADVAASVKQSNAYTSEEISGMINTMKTNGRLKLEVQKFQAAQGKALMSQKAIQLK